MNLHPLVVPRRSAHPALGMNVQSLAAVVHQARWVPLSGARGSCSSQIYWFPESGLERYRLAEAYEWAPALTRLGSVSRGRKGKQTGHDLEAVGPLLFCVFLSQRVPTTVHLRE
jgi:hypothetical protein